MSLDDIFFEEDGEMFIPLNEKCFGYYNRLSEFMSPYAIEFMLLDIFSYTTKQVKYLQDFEESFRMEEVQVDLFEGNVFDVLSSVYEMLLQDVDGREYDDVVFYEYRLIDRTVMDKNIVDYYNGVGDVVEDLFCCYVFDSKD